MNNWKVGSLMTIWYLVALISGGVILAIIFRFIIVEQISTRLLLIVGALSIPIFWIAFIRYRHNWERYRLRKGGGPLR